MWNTSQVSKFLPTATHPYSTSFTEVLTLDGASAELPAIPSANVASSRVPSRVSAGLTSSPLRLPKKRADRPALIVSSTSWTPDEDFSILLDALKQYEGRARVVNELKPGTLPKLLCIITGKGPLKEKYMGEIAMMQSGKGGEKDGRDGQGWKWVRCVSLWLEPEDYPLLLGEAYSIR
jgi:beta-1,4-mannosyltransferase